MDTVGAEIVGCTGLAARPHALVVRLPGGRIARTQTLKAPLAARISAFLVASGPSRNARSRAGEGYRTTGPGPVVEVLAGTTRPWRLRTVLSWVACLCAP
ncbi:hypothetical protein [Streptomyces sp. NPDC050704]|uniref:hypothetical protein n=1 Tax=Streptomyces sp. NPDC050704 TaxID=3157219 RepID=UPI00341AEF70